MEIIDDRFPHEHIFRVQEIESHPWFADFANYLASGVIVKGMSNQEKKKFFSDLKYYFWEDPFLFKICQDRLIRRCVYGKEAYNILIQSHEGPTGGHHGANITARKVLEAGFFWPTIFSDAQTIVGDCDACQRASNISTRNEMPQTNIQVCEVFDV